MTTFIKAILKKSDDKTNIHKYRVAANITNYNITSCKKCKKKNIKNQHV